MCDSLKEDGKCCGECDQNKKTEYVECACGGDIILRDEVIRCLFCKGVICDDCGHVDWNDSDMPVCKSEKCKSKAVKLLVAKLDSAVEDFARIECRTNTRTKLLTKEIISIHEIAQKAYRAAK